MTHERSVLPVCANIVRGDAFGGAQRGMADFLEVTGDTFNHVTVPITDTTDEARSEFERHSDVVLPAHLYPQHSMNALATGVRKIALGRRVGVILGWQHPADAAAIRVGGLPVIMHERHVPDTSSPEAEAEMHEIVAASYQDRGPLRRIVYAAQFSRRAHEAAGINPEIGMVIPAGIDLVRFQRDEAGRRRVRAELGLDDDDMLVGVVTQDRPEKDPEAMLEIATRVIEASRGGRIPHFAVMGYGFEPDNPKWVTALQERGIVPYVHLLGTRTDMPQVYAAMDVNFNPAKIGMSHTALEGYAVGTHFVGTNIGDHEVNLGRTAVLLPPRGDVPLDQWMGVDAFAHELLEMRTRLANPDFRDETVRTMMDRARQFDRIKFAREFGEVALAELRRGRTTPWTILFRPDERLRGVA